MKNIQITEWCQFAMRQQVKTGDLCIDGTMGNGNDTLLLSKLAGETGKVHAFDIQSMALENTRQLLKKETAPENVELHLCSHTEMGTYVKEGTASCIVFNFGYLPGGDHHLATQAKASIEALDLALKLLKPSGLLSLCIYSGGDSGFEEREAILKWLRLLSPKNYLVIVSEYYNRPNHPPLPAMVIKLK